MASVAVCLESSVKLVVKNTFIKFELEHSLEEAFEDCVVHIRKRSKSEGDIFSFDRDHDLMDEQATNEGDNCHEIRNISHCDVGCRLAEREARGCAPDAGLENESTSSEFSSCLDCMDSFDCEDEVEASRQNDKLAHLEIPATSRVQAYVQVPVWNAPVPAMARFSTPFSTTTSHYSWAQTANLAATDVESSMELEIAEAERKVHALRAELAAQRATAQRKGSETQKEVPRKCTSPSKAQWCQNQTSTHVIASSCNELAAEQKREYSNLAITRFNAPWWKPMIACKRES
jgi:hypothetical protein